MIASERWAPAASRAPSAEENTLAARVSAVRALWSPRPPPPPAPSRKMRARRRQPRRLAGPPPLTYCLQASQPLICDPSCKFQFQLDPPRPAPLASAFERLTASVHAALRVPRAPPATTYRGTNVGRYAPTSQRPARGPDRRCGVWWPRDHPKLDNKFKLPTIQAVDKIEEIKETQEVVEKIVEEPVEEKIEEKPEVNPEKVKERVVEDGETPSTSAGSDMARTKRLYSTVLSTNPPPLMNLSPGVRLTQKLSPGLLKLNPKIVLQSARMRLPNVDNKFEELEKEALDQYKGSDESIDSKFRELEKQAVEQYSNSNSNTSCSNASEKRTSSSASIPEVDEKMTPPKIPKDKSVDSVVIYSQNFPDVNKSTPSGTNLKNFHTPPRGEKKEQVHRPCKSRGHKERGGSDPDHEAREARVHKRWSHAVAPKKRHLTMCVSDCSSDEEVVEGGGIADAAPRSKTRAGKMQPSAHGGGDLNVEMRNS